MTRRGNTQKDKRGPRLTTLTKNASGNTAGPRTSLPPNKMPQELGPNSNNGKLTWLQLPWEGIGCTRRTSAARASTTVKSARDSALATCGTTATKQQTGTSDTREVSTFLCD